MERTLSIVKPDGVGGNLIGEVLRRFEGKGVSIVALKMIHLSKEQAEGFYHVHRERPFFGSLTDFMSSGPCVVMVLEGDGAISGVRAIMGATNPRGCGTRNHKKGFCVRDRKKHSARVRFTGIGRLRNRIFLQRA